MSKATSKKAASPKAEKVPSSYADKETVILPARDNNSKYKPTAESTFDAQLLGSRDGVLKLFTDSVKDLYWAENHLVNALPKMIKAAGSEELKTAIKEHLDETRTHVARLENVFAILSVPAQAQKCDAMEGLTKEGEGVIECTDADTPARDIGIIMASQKVEHYEISAYTGLVNLAGKLELNEIGNLLNQTLAEEVNADTTLASIADTAIVIGE